MENFKTDVASAPGCDFSSGKHFQIVPAKENTVYTVNIPGSTQVIVMLVRTDEISVPGNTVRERLLSRYAGQLAFSELREKQSLGYVASAYYSVPSLLPENYSTWDVYLGTQPDKLESALDAILHFSDAMPEIPSLFASSKENALSTLRSARIRPEALYNAQKNLIRLKRPLDEMRKDYQTISTMTPDAFFQDAARHMKNGKNVLVLIGAVDAVKPELLKKYGTVISLKPEMLLVQ